MMVQWYENNVIYLLYIMMARENFEWERTAVMMIAMGLIYDGGLVT